MGESEPTRIDYRRFLPHLSLAWFLKQCGYRCEARVSLPSLNPSTPLAAHFDHYELAKSHNDLPSIVESIEFREQPTFHFINTGETHYPYLMPGERASDVPHLAGLHGTFRDLNEFLARPLVAEEPWMDPRCMRSLHDRQIACIESVDRAIDGLFAKAPPHTWFMVTSDHGELFGEDGFFGHGPICHEKVFEVFFVEGERPE